MISVLILTLNEENNLPACLDTVAWCDDIHVLDSFSTDRTVEIARLRGAHVTLRKFDSFAQHQNWALQNLPFRHPWVFYFDADERVTPELAQAMQLAVLNPGPNVAFRVFRRDFFLATWLKHVQVTKYYDRLFRPDKMRYERLGHCISKPDGPVGTLAGYLDHFPFSKGLAEWVQKHNFYSTQEAEQIVMNRASGSKLHIAALFNPFNRKEFRRNLKELYYKLPFRQLVKFCYMYFFKLGFLDGRAGFTYCVLIAFYEYLIAAKARELQLAQGPGVSISLLPPPG